MPQARMTGQDSSGKQNCSLEHFLLFGVVIFFIRFIDSRKEAVS